MPSHIPAHVDLESRFQILAETIRQHHIYKQNLHSRLFELIVLTSWIRSGESEQLQQERKADGSVRAHNEHVVPLSLLRNHSFQMFDAGAATEEVARVLQRYLQVVEITKEEAAKLDNELGLKSTMPPGWEFGDSPFVRLEAAGIVMHKPSS